MSSLYEKFLNTKIELRDVYERFHTYSARDLNALIESKMKCVKEPIALKQLYNLEAAIADLRVSLEAAKHTAPSKESY